MKLWALNKYWMTYGILRTVTDVLSLMLGLNEFISLLVLNMFGFGCLLAISSLFKVINMKLNPTVSESKLIQTKNGLIDVVYLRDKDVLNLQVAPDAPFWWFIQKVRTLSGGE